MILDEIVADKKRRLREYKARVSPKTMRQLAEEAVKQERTKTEGEKGNAFYNALAKPGISIIGEFKKASPSLGNIRSKVNLTERIEIYNASVDVISCLTEEDHFQGSADYLEKIRRMSHLPILRKDFMIEEYQFYEAKVIGADAILLIAAILDDVQMKEFYGLSRELGLGVLLEVHNEAEMERALELDAEIIGVNNRDLRDFSIHLDTTKRLSGMIPENKIFVSESGIVRDEDVKFLKDCNVDAFLIGRAFMETEHPRKLAQRWKSL